MQREAIECFDGEKSCFFNKDMIRQRERERMIDC